MTTETAAGSFSFFPFSKIGDQQISVSCPSSLPPYTAAGSLDERVADMKSILHRGLYPFPISLQDFSEFMDAMLDARNLKIVEMKDGE